ncbi:S8 family peptidase [Streptomyces colonosanans]|uniref:Peptidase S8 n=1 Tax=Streptomyces colonosanans TaxID=1428652 RepID=A0A1S2NYC9_9ACTN|nr:S8 family serine peptidase [Streptomyces colonosanans]OIJ86480.1 peptidase S8 [Streptomyces colonosanans]
MTAPRKRSRRLVALPLGMAMATTFTLLPNITASAAEPAPTAAATSLSYIVNVATGQGRSATVKKAIADAGGTITIAYDQIGVIVVHSSNPDFARTIREVPGVRSAGATRTAPLATQSTTDMGAPKVLTAEEVASAQAATGQDPLESLQWDLPAIKADKAHEKTLGSHDVTVAVIDTGVDDTHPDLAPNFNRDASVNCVSGKPNTADGAWRPGVSSGSAHGTHVAGEIAAAKNGIGMTGVAPGVQVAGIKVSNPEDYVYTEAVVCGFVWAAEHHVDVTNNSYYTDPWNFNCLDDADQKALVDAITRASQYAEHKGTVNVAAAGNESHDLDADSITDPASPNDSTPGDRVIDPHKCFDIPPQLPGVVTVAATGAKGIKSSFSNYGHGVIDVAAPGGDLYQPPAAPATDGRILGTMPGGKWAYKQGTSMASPHVAGVAALIKSTHPHATAGQVKALLYSEADATPCTDPYDIDSDGKIDAVCKGSKNHNGFYGRGIVNALNAVTK